MAGKVKDTRRSSTVYTVREEGRTALVVRGLGLRKPTDATGSEDVWGVIPLHTARNHPRSPTGIVHA